MVSMLEEDEEESIIDVECDDIGSVRQQLSIQIEESEEHLLNSVSIKAKMDELFWDETILLKGKKRRETARKSAAQFLLDNMTHLEFIRLFKQQVQSCNPSRTLCVYWGELIVYAWKLADNDEDEEFIKSKVETDIVQEMFYYSIVYPKKYAQKFSWVVDGFLPDSGTISKKLSCMFFRCLLPILWRCLEAPNEEIRVAASKLLVKVYPLKAEDAFLNDEYLMKQNLAMEAMLTDECVIIRAEAARKIPFHLLYHWETFPRHLIKIYLEKMVDQLSLDSVDEVRVAVYEGMVHLLPCQPALHATQHALEILGKRGINDKAEKVRLAAFKLLNHLANHRFLKLFELVEMKDILLRLDFEHSSVVQSQIVKLIFKSFCPTKVDGVDYRERFKRIRYMCTISRTASLHFHRLIYPQKLISMEQAVRHIRSILLSVKSFLKQLPDGKDGQNLTAEFDLSELNLTSASTAVSEGCEADVTSLDEDKLALIKSIFDSAVVLWISLRSDLYNKYAKENAEVIKLMSNVLLSIEPYWNTPLVDTALTIAGNLPKDKVGRVSKKVHEVVLRGQYRDAYFNHYIEAISSWDMDALLEIISKGLDVLYHRVACDSNGEQLRIDAPILQQQQRKDGNTPQSSDRDSPPVKRPRRLNNNTKGKKKGKAKKESGSLDDDTHLECPLEFIKILLANPNSCENLKSCYRFQLLRFCKTLRKIRSAFGVRLRLNDFNNVDVQLLSNAYGTLTLLSLIIGSVEGDADDEKENNDEDGQGTSDNEDLSNQYLDYYPQDSLLLAEIKWFDKVAREATVPNEIIKMFLKYANLHLECTHLSPRILLRMTDMLCEIYESVDMDVLGGEVEKSAKHLTKTLEYCEDRLMADGLSGRLKRMLINTNDANEDEDVE